MLLHELFKQSPQPKYPYLDQVILADSASNPRSIQILNEERKWVSGRFDQNIGIDRPTHLAGREDAQTHAHVFGRKRNELGVVNFNGTGSHGSKFTLHSRDADELRRRGFNIRPDNIVEWVKLAVMPQIILG